MFAFAKPVDGLPENDPSGDFVVGFDYGLKREDAVAFQNTHPGWSLILNSEWRLEASTLFLLTYADVTLARAEGLARGWSTGLETSSVAGLYELALQGSWEQWGVYDAIKFEAYMDQPDVDLTGDLASDLEKIGTQRWLTFFPNGPQGWSEWRRTGFPALEPTPNAVNTSKEIPVRFAYPSVEYGFNKANLDVAVSRLENGDRDDSHVWWDVD